jgi:protease secretion system outer membrane protein
MMHPFAITKSLLPLNACAAIWRFMHVGLCGMLIWVATPTLANDFVKTLELAYQNDRPFQTAKSERDLGVQESDRAALVYLPSVSLERGRSPFESKDRTTTQITQPLLDIDRYASYQEMTDKRNYALATFAVKELDLARKVFKVISNLVQLREMQALALSEAKDLERQAQRAMRRLELGNGTSMDVTTAQVQHAQALARYQSLQAEIGQAEQKYFSLTSKTTVLFHVRPDYERASAFTMPAFDAAQEFQNNPLVLQARAQLEFAKLGLVRSKSAFMPVVNAVIRSTDFNGGRDNYWGLHISTPMGISAYSLSAKQKAELEVQKAQALLDEILEQSRLEEVSSGFAVKAYAREMAYRNTAVRVSQATVSSTEKAYAAGLVRANDVVTAILASFDVQRQRLNLIMNLADLTLNHQLSRGVPPYQAISLMQSFFVPDASDLAPGIRIP